MDYTLSQRYPDIANEWDYEANGELTPDKITCGSSKKVAWICPVGHKYSTRIFCRTTGHGCPICGRLNNIGAPRSKDNKLITKFPEIAKEYLQEKNDRPLETITFGSNYAAWWKCQTCGNEWKASVNKRHLGTGCPACAKSKHDNNVITTRAIQNPLSENKRLLKEWDYKKNVISPFEVSAKSNFVVWWKCSRCQTEWQAQILSRSAQKNTCPICSKKKRGTSFTEYIVFHYVAKYNPDSIYQYKSSWLKQSSIDIFCPKENIAIEYDGTTWHRNSERDSKKDQKLLSHGITPIRIRQKGCPEISSSVCFYQKKTSYQSLEEPIKELLSYLKIENPSVNLEEDIADIRTEYMKYLTETTGTIATT